jgi:CubicO group peptidase (beta-lactamase class C family)
MIPLYRILWTVFVFVFFPLLAIGQAKSKAPETIQELQIAIERVSTDPGTPAVGVAWVKGDSIVWVAGLGEANLEKKVKATEKTMFRIGSVSKMFVSLAILKLQEEGRISLKDKVRDLAPEIEFNNPWEKTAPILVEHLLEHTTGWDDLHLTDYALNDPTLSLKQGLDYHPHSRTSRWMPGTRMAYSNSGPPVAAYIIEKITRQPFEAYIQEHFFQPLDMPTATYFASENYKQRGATLYNNREPQPYWNIILRPSGAINASPVEMANMLRFFINRGRVGNLHLLNEASLKRMETPSTTSGAKAGLDYGYGLANYSTPHKSFVYRTHTGGVIGGLTDFSYLPAHQVGYAIMINAGNGNAINRISELIRNFQTKPLKADSVSLKKAVPDHENDISGYYVAINPRIQMTYFLGRLTNVKHLWTVPGFIFMRDILGGGTETHVAINDHQYVSKETGKISLVRVNDPLAGDVVHVGSQVLMRISPLIAFGQLILVAVWALYLVGSVLFGSIWLIRFWLGKTSTKNRRSPGLWPFAASLLFLTTLILLVIGGQNPLELLGKVSFVSVSIMLLSVCFALASVWSVITVIKERNAKMNRTIYWHAAILSGLHLLVTCYLLWHGVIGLQTWS